MRPVLVVLALLAAAAPANAAEFTLDEASLAAAVRDVLPDVEKETGVDLSKLEIKIGTRADLRRTLLPELTDQLRVTLGDEAAARAQAKATATMLAAGLIGKYAYDEKVVFLCRENLRTVAPLLEEPLLLSAEGVRVVLVHECVHAADDIRYDLRAGLRSVKSTEATECFAAVLEGHAQVLTRRICQRKGWGEAFEAFTRSIDKVPAKGLGEGEKEMIRILGAKMASAYHEGEKFMRVVESEGGADAVRRAFRSPPTELVLVEHPEWYLDPSKRPAPEVDLATPLKKLIEVYPAETWAARETSLTKAQLRTSFKMLPEVEREWMVEAVKASHALLFNPRLAPNSKMVLGALYRLPSAKAAERYVELSMKLSRIKDEKMSTGSVRITSSSYHTTEGARWTGEVAEKEIEAGAQLLAVKSLSARQGPFVLELVWSVEPVESSEIVKMATLVLDGVQPKPK